MEGSTSAPGPAQSPIILATNPDPRGFFFRYLMAATPLLLAIVSAIATAAIYGFMGGFTSGLGGTIGSSIPGMGDMVDITVFLTAPIGIFALFAMIGWMMRFTEIWTSTGLALGLSSLAGVLLVVFFPDKTMNRITDLLSWIAYLIIPASLVAVLIVLAWTDKFRRSIRYTITNEGVITSGGIWKRQEHMLPHHQIGRLVMEQDLVGRFFRTGTIIPIGTAQWGSEMSLRGMGVGGQKDNVNVGLGYAKTRQEVSRYPLDCLYGVREPEKIMAVLGQLISRPAERGEEQVSYLKKIYEKL